MIAIFAVVGALALGGAFPLAAQEQSAEPVPPRFHFGVFGALDLLHTIDTHQDVINGGEVDLYSSWRMSDKWSALGEVLVQHVREGAERDTRLTKRTELDIERLYVAYSPSDLLRLEAGQIHTGLVQWNEREHRGRFLQTSIDTPALARREEQGGAWPLHFVGLWGSGLVPGPLGVTYGAGLGEGRGQFRDEIQTLSDPESTPAFVLSLGMAPDVVPGLELGVSAYRGKVPAPGGRLEERDVTVSGSYVNGRVEIRGEWGRMNHTHPSANVTYFTDGRYLLASYRLPGHAQAFRPYALVDELSVPDGEQYLAQVERLRAWAAGLRWDAGRHVALKLDYRSQQVGVASRERLLRLQLAFSF